MWLDDIISQFKKLEITQGIYNFQPRHYGSRIDGDEANLVFDCDLIKLFKPNFSKLDVAMLVLKSDVKDLPQPSGAA